MRKKILFFIFDLGHGGAENVLVNLVSLLDKTKYDITVQTLFDYGENKKRLPADIKYKTFFKRKPFRGITYLLSVLPPRFLYNIIIKDSYDIAIAYLENSTTRIISGCNSKAFKKYAWVHATKFGNSTFLTNTALRKCYERYDKVAFVSESAKNNFLELYKNLNIKAQVVYNTIDVTSIQKKSCEDISITLNNDIINFCSVGRLIEAKGYVRLLKVLLELKNEGLCNWKFYLLGEGSQKLQIEHFIRLNNLEDNVELLGYQANPHKYVAKMDLFICSSFNEGYSTAVTESIINGVPILTTECSGMKEILGDSNAGIIVENSEKGLMEGLKSILTEKDRLKYMKEEAMRRSEFFSIDRTIKQFEEFIND